MSPFEPGAAAPVLSVRGLSVEFATGEGAVRAVNDVSFHIDRGEIFGLAGESGCGKSTVAHALLRLLPRTASYTGTVDHGGRNVLAMTDAQLRSFRWDAVSLVMQGAMNALNPVMTVERQIVDVIRAHRRVSVRQARARVPQLLEMVGIEPGRRRAYPHELSGGMRQRCVIAMALALEPELVIMDEPTTALDVVVQRAIMDEIDRLRQRLGFSVLLISHDLDLIAERASRIAIMYAGSIVELGSAQAVVSTPQHPYTQALLASSMSLDGPATPIEALAGQPPVLSGPPSGCPFYARCARAQPAHARSVPVLRDVAGGHHVACHLYDPVKAAR